MVRGLASFWGFEFFFVFMSSRILRREERIMGVEIRRWWYVRLVDTYYLI